MIVAVGGDKQEAGEPCDSLLGKDVSSKTADTPTVQPPQGLSVNFPDDVKDKVSHT